MRIALTVPLTTRRPRLSGVTGRRRGSLTVELALTIPALLVIVFGTVEMGYLFSDYLLLQNSAREAVRLAAVGGSPTEVRERVAKNLPGISPFSVEITCEYRMWLEMQWGEWRQLTAGEEGNVAPYRSQVRATVCYHHPVLIAKLFPGPGAASQPRVLPLTVTAVLARE